MSFGRKIDNEPRIQYILAFEHVHLAGLYLTGFTSTAIKTIEIQKNDGFPRILTPR